MVEEVEWNRDTTVNVLRVVVLQMDDISSLIPDQQKQWGAGMWNQYPPVVQLSVAGNIQYTSGSSSLAWGERFLFKLSESRKTCRVEVSVDQNRGLLRGGNLSVVRGWFSIEDVTSAVPGESWIERVRLDPNPTLEMTSSEESPIFLDLKLEAIYHSEPELLIERCHQGAEDSEDSEEDEKSDGEEEGEEKKESEEGKDEAKTEANKESNSKSKKAVLSEAKKLKKRVASGKKKPKISKEAELEAKKEAEEQERLASIKVHSGIYQVVVHVLEARSLKGSTGLASLVGSGVPDPLVAVTVGEEKKRTRVLPAVENAVFDDTFKFELDLTAANFGQHSVEIEAVDTHTPMPGGEAIGKFVVDFESVYFANPQHELYRQWVGLDSSDGKGKTCGFILVSITIMGPGEDLPFHDRKAEMALEAQEGAVMGQVMTSGGDKSYESLRMRLHRAVGLPPMDFANNRWTGLDALVQLNYASLPKHHTRTRPKFVAFSTTNEDTQLDQGCGFIGCRFDTEIKIPVLVPTVNHNVAIGIADADPGLMDSLGLGSKTGPPTQSVARGDDIDLRLVRKDSKANQHDFDSRKAQARSKSVVGRVFQGSRSDDDDEEERQRELDEVGIGGGETRFGKPFWRHLYGAPMPCVNIGSKNDAYVSPSLADACNNGHAKDGCAYRGSLLMSARVEPPVKVKGDAPKVKRMKAEKVRASEEPITSRHVVRCAVYGISGLKDTSGNLGGLVGGSGTRYSLTVSMGHATAKLGSVVVARNSMAISSGANKEGIAVAWLPPPKGSYDVDGVGTEWPTSQLPDVFVSLYEHTSRGSVRSLDAEGYPKGEDIMEQLSDGNLVAFTRFTSDMLWGVHGEDVKMAQPRWISLKKSPITSKPLKQVQLLIRLGVETEEVAATAPPWPVLDASITTPYALYIHLFQARGLPAADENGRLDPYVRCDVAGETIQSPTHSATTNPQFATSICFTDLNLPTSPELTAPLCMSVFDFDQWSSHDEVGRIQYPLALARQATVAFKNIEDDLVMHIALILSKHGEVQVEEDLMASPFKSLERGGGVVDVCLTCHTDYLWIWVSVTPKHLTLSKASDLVKEHYSNIVEKVAALVTKRVQNVPLKMSLRKPVHVEVLTFGLPRQITGALDMKHLENMRKKYLEERGGNMEEFAKKLSSSAVVTAVVGSKLNRLALTPEGRPSLVLSDQNTCFKNCEPHWLPLRGVHDDNTHGDLGELLFRVELVDLSSQPVPRPVLTPPERLTSVPASKQWLDIMILGCRDLISKDALPLNNIVVKFTCAGQILVNLLDDTMRSDEKTALSAAVGDSALIGRSLQGSLAKDKNLKRYLETNPAHKPTASNPNIIERFVVPVMLPTDPELNPSLEINVLDRRPLIGDCLVGTAAIDLCECTPYAMDGSVNRKYRRPGTVTEEDDIGNPFMAAGASKEMRDAFKAREKRRAKAKRDKQEKKDKQLASRSVKSDGLEDVTKALEEDMDKLNEGFANMGSAMKDALNVFDDSDDEKEVPPEWMNGRSTLTKEFESPGTTSDPVRPYDVIRIMRGSDFDLMATGSRQVGVLKMVVRVCSTPPAMEGEVDEELGFSDSASESSQPITGRTIDTSYVDRWWPSLSQLNGMVNNDPKAKATVLTRLRTSPPAYICRVYVLEGRGLSAKDLNGKSDPYVRAKVGDGDEVSGRDRCRYATLDPDFFIRMEDIPISLPGPSTLELSVWDYDSITGDDHIGSTLIDLEDRWFSTQWKDTSDASTRPLEWRSLWSPSSTFSQGRVSVITEIMTTHEARTIDKWPIEKPEPEDWEVRVVVWKCRGVPASDLGGFSDAYLRLFLIGHENNAQQTDTHLRSQRGKSSFNYRIKLPVKLPLSTTAEGAGRLVIQIWDFDMLEGDDMIGTASVDLSRHMFAAQKRHVDFLKATENIQGKGKAPIEDSYRVFIENDKKEERKKEAAKQKTLAYRMTHKKPKESPKKMSPRKSDTIPEGEGLEGLEVELANEGNTGGGSYSLSSLSSQAAKFKGVAAAKLADTLQDSDEESEPEFGEFGEEEKESAAQQATAALVEKAKNIKKKKKKTAKPASAWDQLNEALGKGPDPENSLWVPLKRRKGNKELKAGEALLSIELLPYSLANGAMAAGAGRSEPNNFPELPPPTGRFNPHRLFSPFYMIENIIGTDLLYQVAGLVACGGALAGLVIVFPALLAWCQFAASTTLGWGWWLTLAFIIMSVLACCVVRYELIRNANFDPCRSSCKKVCPMDFARPHDSDDESGLEDEEETESLVKKK